MSDVGRAPNVLIVTEDYPMLRNAVRTLRTWGFSPITCPGPNVSPDCPRLAGEPCPLREYAETALVDVDPHGTGESRSTWQERVCTRLPDDGRTTFVVRGAGRDVPWEGCVPAPATLTEGALIALVEQGLESPARGRAAAARFRDTFRRVPGQPVGIQVRPSTTFRAGETGDGPSNEGPEVYGGPVTRSEDELLVLLGDEADLHARPAADEEFILDLS